MELFKNHQKGAGNVCRGFMNAIRESMSNSGSMAGIF